MVKVSKAGCWLIAFCLLMAVAPSVGRRFVLFAQSSPRSATVPETPQASHEAQNAEPDIPEEPAEDELAPAAVQLDVSKQSPLLQALYKATRETKEKDILARLDEARQLIASGAASGGLGPSRRFRRSVRPDPGGEPFYVHHRVV